MKKLKIELINIPVEGKSLNIRVALPFYFKINVGERSLSIGKKINLKSLPTKKEILQIVMSCNTSNRYGD